MASNVRERGALRPNSSCRLSASRRSMKVLVTGGTGLIGGVRRSGRCIVAVTRCACAQSPCATRRLEKSWPSGVEAWVGDVTNENSIRGAGENCDVVLHIAGIAEEKLPSDATFRAVNVQGTRFVLDEAERAGVNKIVYVSSLGAERWTSRTTINRSAWPRMPCDRSAARGRSCGRAAVATVRATDTSRCCSAWCDRCR